MEKIIKIFAKTIIVLFCLSLFASVIQHVSQGGTRYGFLTEPIRAFSSLPGYFKEAVSSVNNVPKTFIKTPQNFKAINQLKKDVIVLVPFTNKENGRSVKLLNLKNNKTSYTWNIPGSFEEHYRLLNPILLPDKSLCYSVANYSGVKRIDSLGNLIWEQSKVNSHHSFNLDTEGDLWMCAREMGSTGEIEFDGVFKKNGKTEPFINDLIVKLDTDNGKILIKKSLTEILKENNLLHLLKKTHVLQDPYHTNDVEPVLKSGKYHEIGDVYISIRHLSLVLLYRPSTNKVLKIIEGPFSFQHDVDIVNDSTITIFNNNEIVRAGVKLQLQPAEFPIEVDVSNSNIVSYSLSTDEFDIHYDSLFSSNGIYTASEGLHQSFGKDSIFVEEQNSGVIWVIKGNDVIYKNVLPSHIEGYHHLPNWLRIIEN